MRKNEIRFGGLGLERVEGNKPDYHVRLVVHRFIQDQSVAHEKRHRTTKVVHTDIAPVTGLDVKLVNLLRERFAGLNANAPSRRISKQKQPKLILAFSGRDGVRPKHGIEIFINWRIVANKNRRKVPAHRGNAL